MIQAARHNDVPVTGRPSEMLAANYGYQSLAAMADSLPPNAQVVDVGAGVSPLGSSVAALRPDIHWTNIDPVYSTSWGLEKVLPDAPENISFNPIDVRNITDEYGDNSFEAVLSYWLFPHLMEKDPAVANLAATQIYRVAKLGGRLSIGPNAGEQFKYGGNTFVAVKTNLMDADEYAREVTARVHVRGTYKGNDNDQGIIRIPL